MNNPYKNAFMRKPLTGHFFIDAKVTRTPTTEFLTFNDDSFNVITSPALGVNSKTCTKLMALSPQVSKSLIDVLNEYFMTLYNTHDAIIFDNKDVIRLVEKHLSFDIEGLVDWVVSTESDVWTNVRFSREYNIMEMLRINKTPVKDNYHVASFSLFNIKGNCEHRACLAKLNNDQLTTLYPLPNATSYAKLDINAESAKNQEEYNFSLIDADSVQGILDMFQDPLSFTEVKDTIKALKCDLTDPDDKFITRVNNNSGFTLDGILDTKELPSFSTFCNLRFHDLMESYTIKYLESGETFESVADYGRFGTLVKYITSHKNHYRRTV